MSGPQPHTNARVGAMRTAFDRSFALAPGAQIGAAAVENVLTVRLGPHPYALRLADVSGLFVDRNVTWLPSPVAELLGIAGLRGTILPVYDLGMLLGHRRAAAPRWLLVAAATPVGLAFDGFDGYLSVRREAIVPASRGETLEPYVREMLRAEITRSVIHLPSVLEAIRNLGGPDRQT